MRTAGSTGLESDSGSQRVKAGSYVALAVATLVFTVNFWAWGLISPLGTKFKDILHLSPLALSVLVAVPVIVGSLGRIPLGGLTDRYGGRLMLTLVSLASMIPVAFLVTGMVGAAGGLGGFLPPIVMGIVYQLDHSYGIGLMLLSDVALAALVFVAFRLRPAATRTTTTTAPATT